MIFKNNQKKFAFSNSCVIMVSINMKKVMLLLTVGAFIFMGTGCTSTLVLGPKANKDKCLNASADWSHVGVTLPLVKAGVQVHKKDK